MCGHTRPTIGGMAETPVRKLRIEDELWERVNAQAAETGETASGYIRRAILRALKEDQS